MNHDENQTRLREKLADNVHDAWGRWMTHVFRLSELNADGSVTIPSESVDRWKRQIETAYVNLTQQEQDSDRAEADRILSIFSALGMLSATDRPQP